MAMKGKEIKVHFTFVMDKFPSAIILVVCMTAGKGLYQMTSLDNFKILKLDFQTHQGKCSLD